MARASQGLGSGCPFRIWRRRALPLFTAQFESTRGPIRCDTNPEWARDSLFCSPPVHHREQLSAVRQRVREHRGVDVSHGAHVFVTNREHGDVGEGGLSLDDVAGCGDGLGRVIGCPVHHRFATWD